MHDPAERIDWHKLKAPPVTGAGSGKEAWVAFAARCAAANIEAHKLIAEQSAAIKALQGEVVLLKRRIATRKPKGGRPPLPDDVKARLEHEIELGGSDRVIAGRYGVSHVTVYRVRKRMEQRRQV
jgi:DNA invertase Pin-like site-specific DNA recombinase